jgi:chaperonin GroES
VGQLQPLSNFVLVKIREAKSQTLGGIVLPDQAKEKPTEGVIVAVGPGRVHPDTNVLIQMPVAVGDRVLYGKFDGSKV